MEIFLAIGILGMSILGLSIGIIFKGQPLSGSCGGSPNSCEVCKGDLKKCTSNS